MGMILSAMVTISGWVAAILFGMMLFMIVMMTKDVSMPVLKAKMSRASLILVQRVDQTYKLVAGKNKGKYIDTKEFGKFKVSDNTFKPFAGVTLAQAYEATPVIPTTEFIKACKMLLNKGYEDINENMIIELQNRLDKNQEELSVEDYEKMLEDNGITPKTKKKLEKLVKERKFLDSVFSSISCIQNFLLTGGSPIEMDSIIEQEAAMKAQQKSKDNLARILTIGMAAGIVIAAIIGLIYVYGSMATCPTIAQYTQLAQQCAAGGATKQIPI